jgi:sugar phosphate isomerase/epimerase
MLEKNREFYRLLIPDAQKAGVKICVENMFRMDLNSKIIRDSICASPYEFAQYVDTFNQDADIFCACLDVGHSVLAGINPAQAIRVLGDRLTCLHIHDVDGKNDNHTCPGTLIVDFPAIVEALREVGYPGEFTLEAMCYLDKLPQEQWFEAVCHMQKVCCSLLGRE